MVARNRLVINGTLGSGDQEAWSTSLHFTLPDGSAITDNTLLAEWAERAHDVLEVALTGNTELAIRLSSAGKVQSVDTYGYGASGGAVASGSFAGVIAGSGAPAMPPQCSVVFSLGTAIPGGSFRGRMYWPCLGPGISSSLVYNSSSILATLAVGLVEALAVSMVEDGAGVPVVYSPTRDIVTPVTSVRVGNVIDTQRRRRDALVETYQVRPYPPTP